MDTHSKGVMAVITGNVIFGFSFLFSRMALDVAIPSVLVAYRFLTAFAVMNLIVWTGRRLKKNGRPLIEFSLRGKPLKNVLLLALFQPVLYFFCETYGIYYTSAAFSGTIIAVIPIMGIVFDRILMGSEIRIKQIVCAAVSVAGVIVTTIGAEGMKSSLTGVIFLSGAVCFGSLFYVFSKKSSEDYSAIERTYVMFGVGSAVFTVYALVECRGDYAAMIIAPAGNSVFIISTLYLAVISSVAAFVCQNWGNNFVTVSEATLFANLTTVISIAAGVVFLGESFTVQQIAGAAAILISVYIANVKKLKRERRQICHFS